MARREEILEALKAVELLSSPALGALQVLSDINADSDKVGRIIELDPALTTNVLRFANSAYFGCRCEIQTVREALVRLGMKTIARMVYMSAGAQLSPHRVKGYDLEPGVLWDHMVTTAVATEMLARQLKFRSPPTAFTAALLHDVGKLVLGTNLGVDVEPIKQLAKDEEITFPEAETRILGINHAEVGAELLASWNLPESLTEAIRWHLDPNGSPDDDKQLVDLLHAANAIAMLHDTGLGVDGYNYDVCRDTQTRLGITRDTVALILCEIDDEVKKLTEVAEF